MSSKKIPFPSFFSFFFFPRFRRKKTNNRDRPNVSLFSFFPSLESMTRREYALEIQRHWAEELLSGRKTVELRGYPLPEAVGKSGPGNLEFSSFFFLRLPFSSLSLSSSHLFLSSLLFKSPPFGNRLQRIQPSLAPRHRRPRRPSSPRGRDRPSQRPREGRDRRMGEV